MSISILNLSPLPTGLILNLPIETLHHIISYIVPDKTCKNINSLFNLFLSNSHFRSILSDSDIEKIKYNYTPILTIIDISSKKRIETYRLPNGIDHGEYNVYKHNKLLRKGQCKYHKPDGLWTIYYPRSDKRREEKYYTDGKRVGLTKIYNLNGKVVSIKCHNREGLIHGIYKSYYSNGTPNWKGQYDNNKKVGLWKKYRNGITITECYWVNNLKEGLYVSYTNSGELLQEGGYINDKKEGIWYNYVGDKCVSEHWKNGVLII